MDLDLSPLKLEDSPWGSLVSGFGVEKSLNQMRPIGFFIDVTPVSPIERGMDYKISVKRSLPEMLPGGDIRVNSQNYEATLNVPHNGAVVISGLLPRKQIVEGEDELYKPNILKALLDAAFVKGDEEFTVIIQPYMFENPN